MKTLLRLFGLAFALACLHSVSFCQGTGALISDLVPAFKNRGAFSSGTTYAVNDVVSQGGALYYAPVAIASGGAAPPGGAWLSFSSGLSAQPVGFNLITGFGDSLTGGNEDGTGITYPSQLSSLLGQQVINAGIGSQTSTQICVRMGACPTAVTVTGGSIPTTGSVVVTFTSGSEPAYHNGPVCVLGTILSVTGNTCFDGTSVYTFTPTTYPSSSVSVSAGTAWHPVLGNELAGLVIIGEGRNNYGAPSTVLANIASSVAVAPTHLVLSVLNSNIPSEWSGQANYTTITGINSSLATAYGANYLDWRAQLVAYGCASSVPDDVIDCSHNVPPTSLRAQDQSGTLAAALSSTTSCPVLSNPSFVGSTIIIGSEHILVTGVSGNTVTTCNRGYASTTATTYASGTAWVGIDSLHLGQNVLTVGGTNGYTVVAALINAWIQANIPGSFGIPLSNVKQLIQNAAVSPQLPIAVGAGGVALRVPGYTSAMSVAGNGNFQLNTNLICYPATTCGIGLQGFEFGGSGGNWFKGLTSIKGVNTGDLTLTNSNGGSMKDTNDGSFQFTGANVIPGADQTGQLGEQSTEWQKLWLRGQAQLKGTTLVQGLTPGDIVIQGSGGGIFTDTSDGTFTLNSKKICTYDGTTALNCPTVGGNTSTTGGSALAIPVLSSSTNQVPSPLTITGSTSSPTGVTSSVPVTAPGYTSTAPVTILGTGSAEVGLGHASGATAPLPANAVILMSPIAPPTVGVGLRAPTPDGTSGPLCMPALVTDPEANSGNGNFQSSTLAHCTAGTDYATPGSVSAAQAAAQAASDPLGTATTAVAPLKSVQTAGAGGVTVNTFVSKDASSPIKMVTAAVSTCGEGIASSTTASGSTFTMLENVGTPQVLADGAIAAGDIIVGSPTIPGYAHDSGQTTSTNISQLTFTCGVAKTATTASGQLVTINPLPRGARGGLIDAVAPSAVANKQTVWGIISSKPSHPLLSTNQNNTSFTNNQMTDDYVETIPAGINPSAIEVCYTNMSTDGSSPVSGERPGLNSLNIGAAVAQNTGLTFTATTNRTQALFSGRQRYNLGPGGVVCSDPVYGYYPAGSSYFVLSSVNANPVAAPTAPTLAAGTSGNLSNGTYTVAIGYVLQDGTLSQASASSQVLSAGTSTQNVVVTAPSASQGMLGWKAYVGTSTSKQCGIGAGVLPFSLGTISITSLTTLELECVNGNAVYQYIPLGAGQGGGTAAGASNSGEGLGAGDKTPYGFTPGSGYLSSAFGPYYILGNVKSASLAAVGDSITGGSNDAGFGTGGGGFLSRAALGQTSNRLWIPGQTPNYGFVNCAQPSETAATFNSYLGTKRFNICSKASTVYEGYGINDISGTTTALLNNIVQIDQNFLGVGVNLLRGTLLPQTTYSSDGWQTIAGQSWAIPSTEGRRRQVNNFIRGTGAGVIVTGEVPFAAKANGVYAASTNWYAGGDGTTTKFIPAFPIDTSGTTTVLVNGTSAPYTYVGSASINNYNSSNQYAESVNITTAPANGATVTMTYLAAPSMATMLGNSPNWHLFDTASYIEYGIGGSLTLNGGLWGPAGSTVLSGLTVTSITAGSTVNFINTGGWAGITSTDQYRSYSIAVTADSTAPGAVGETGVITLQTLTQITAAVVSAVGTAAFVTPDANAVFSILTSTSTGEGTHPFTVPSMTIAAGLAASGLVK